MGYTDTQTRRVTISELVQFEPKQQEAFDRIFTHRYVLFGGARGPGKSYWLRSTAILYNIYLAKTINQQGIRFGLFCENYPSLRDRQISKFELLPIWLGEVKTTQSDGLGFYLHARHGGGIIAFRNLDDASKYQSAEFASVFIDELTKNTVGTFNLLRGSLRWPGVDHTVIAAASNPGSVGHLWVKQYWMDKIYPPEMESKADQFVYIPALPTDNPHLSQSYWDELNSLPPDLYKAWVLGDWNVFAGQAFGTWSNARHVIDPKQMPAHWPRYRGVDWGSAAPFCCLWGAKDPDTGRWYIYREAYQSGLTDRQQASLIREMTPPTENILATYADPALWARKNIDNIVTSAADQYAAEGVPLLQADNDRLSGKRKVDRMLADLPDGRPGAQIFKTCVNLIRTLPALPYDDVRIEDVDTKAEDHAYDAFRYLTTGDIQREKKDEPRRQSHPLARLKHM